HIQTYFTGYAPSDLDSVVEQQYTEDGTFATLVSQKVWSKPVSFQPQNGASGFDMGIMLFSGYDYRIIIPATSQTFQVTGLQDSALTQYSTCGYAGGCRGHFTTSQAITGNYLRVSNAQASTGEYDIALEK